MVQSWLHITDNAHFIEKVEDVTCRFTNISNSEMVDLAIKLNLNSFIDKDLSSVFTDEKDKIEEPAEVLQNDSVEKDETCFDNNSESKIVIETNISKNALTKGAKGTGTLYNHYCNIF